MRDRCENPNSTPWQYYGGRGITICPQWKKFETFLEDMGPCPSDKHTIDRLDNDGNYEPGNCQWQTTMKQARNKSNNRWLTVNGRRMVIADWAQETGLTAQTIRKRLERGLSDEQAVSTVRERSPRSTLTAELVRELRVEYEVGAAARAALGKRNGITATLAALGKKYGGITGEAVRAIVTRKTWAHVP